MAVRCKDAASCVGIYNQRSDVPCNDQCILHCFLFAHREELSLLEKIAAKRSAYDAMRRCMLRRWFRLLRATCVAASTVTTSRSATGSQGKNRHKNYQGHRTQFHRDNQASCRTLIL